MELNINDYVDYAASVKRSLEELKNTKFPENAPEFVKENYRVLLEQLEGKLRRVEAVRDEKLVEWIAAGEPEIEE